MTTRIETRVVQMTSTTQSRPGTPEEVLGALKAQGWEPLEVEQGELDQGGLLAVMGHVDLTGTRMYVMAQGREVQA